MLCGVLGQGWISGRDFWLLEYFALAPSSAQRADRNQSERHSSHQSGGADLLLLLVLPFLALSPSSFINL